MNCVLNDKKNLYEEKHFLSGWAAKHCSYQKYNSSDCSNNIQSEKAENCMRMGKSRRKITLKLEGELSYCKIGESF